MVHQQFFINLTFELIFLIAMLIFLGFDNMLSNKYRGYRRLLFSTLISIVYFYFTLGSNDVKAMFLVGTTVFIILILYKFTELKHTFAGLFFIACFIFSCLVTNKIFAATFMFLPILNLVALLLSTNPVYWWELLLPKNTSHLTLIEKDKLIDPLWVFYDPVNSERDIGDEVPIQTNVIKSKIISFRDASYMKLQSPEKLSKALTNIKQRDGEFSYEAFLRRATPVCKRIHNAINSNKIEKVDYLLSDALVEQLKYMAGSDTNKHVSANFAINDMRIAQVNSNANFDILHLFIRAVSYDYANDKDIEKNNLLISDLSDTNKKLIERNVTEYYTFIRKPSAKTLNRPGLLEGKCPNCGASIEVGEHTVCKFCKSFIRSGEHDWVLAKITPAVYWDYIEPDNIVGYNELCANDPGFSVQQVEDKSGVLYWLLEKAEREKNSKSIKRFATPNFCETFERKKFDEDNEAIICRSVNLKAIEIAENKEYCYVTVKAAIDGLVNDDGEEISSQQVYVLSRNKGKITKINRALSSVHCPNCGAPLNSSFSDNCEYCGIIINDGSEWALDKIVNTDDEKYCELVEKTNNKDRKITKSELEELQLNDTLAVSAQILMADGKIDEREYELLLTIAKETGVNEKQLNKILDNIKQGFVHVPLPNGGIKAENIIRSATRMAFADRELSDEEMETIINIGYQMGYSKLDIKRIVNSEISKLHKEGENIIRKSSNTIENDYKPLQRLGANAAKLTPAEIKIKKQEAYDILNVSIQIMLADGIMDKKELEYLQSLAKSLEIPFSVVNETINNVKSGICYIPTPSFGSVKAEKILRSAIKMSLADNVLNEQEQQLLFKLGNKMGYTALDINTLINSERMNISNKQSLDKDNNSRKV